ncbi:nucleoside deaminase [Streptomyces stramineus]
MMLAAAGTGGAVLLTHGTAAPAHAAGSHGRTRWIGDWPELLKNAAVEAVPAAVEEARRRRPFGAVLVDRASGRVLVREGNASEGGDQTAHAEMNVLRSAAARRVPVAGQLLVSTAEPCPMCAGALLWSRVGAIACGTSIARLAAYGVPQIDIPLTALASHSPYPSPALALGLRADLTDPLYRDFDAW